MGRGVILSGLLRTVAWLGLFAVVCFDGTSLFTNRVLLDEAARVAAAEAAAEWRTVPRVEAAYQGAVDSLVDQAGVELVEVRLEGREVALTAQRRSRVVLADRIPWVDSFVQAVVTVRAPLDHVGR
jgi:hypothetical protein